MKMSAGAPASICFASALLAAIRDDHLVAGGGLELPRLLVQRLLEARRGEDRHVRSEATNDDTVARTERKDDRAETPVTPKHAYTLRNGRSVIYRRIFRLDKRGG